MELQPAPKYFKEIPIDGLTPQQFLELAIDVAKNLKWNISYSNESSFIAYTPSISASGEEIHVDVRDNIASLQSESIDGQSTDIEKNRNNIEDFIGLLKLPKSNPSLKTARARFGELKQQPEELNQRFVSYKERLIDEEPVSTERKISIFTFKEGYRVTPILIGVNVLVYFLMVASGVNIINPDSQSLLRWGANYGPLTLSGEWWRLISNYFIHIGFLHLAFNMYALLYIGILLEKYLGSMKYFIAYMLTGLVASIVSLSWHSNTISAGASGAIFGMYGVFVALLSTNLIERSVRKNLITSIGVFVVFNLLNGLKAGIDNAAHIGGLLSGLVIGYAYIPSIRKPKLTQTTIVVTTVCTLLVSFLIYGNIPNASAIYKKKMQTFYDLQTKALEIYQLPSSTSREDLLDAIKNNAIRNWNENRTIIVELDKLDLPDATHKRDEKMLEYCNLRIKSCELMYKGISEGDIEHYSDEQKNLDAQIEALVKEINE